ncbi:hypothetical protein ACQP3D_27140, partial [Escherichia coli]
GTIKNDSWKFYSYPNVAKTKDKSAVLSVVTSLNVLWPFGDLRGLAVSGKKMNSERDYLNAP